MNYILDSIQGHKRKTMVNFQQNLVADTIIRHL